MQEAERISRLDAAIDRLNREESPLDATCPTTEDAERQEILEIACRIKAAKGPVWPERDGPRETAAHLVHRLRPQPKGFSRRSMIGIAAAAVVVAVLAGGDALLRSSVLPPKVPFAEYRGTQREPSAAPAYPRRMNPIQSQIQSMGPLRPFHAPVSIRLRPLTGTAGDPRPLGMDLQNPSRRQAATFLSRQATLLLTPWGTAAAIASVPFSLPARLAPGQSTRVSVTLPRLAPGWYSASLGNLEYHAGGTTSQVEFPATPLFIPFPAGGVHESTLQVQRSTTVQGIRLTVEQIRFSARHTTVTYRIPGVPIPGGGTVTLQAGGQEWPALSAGIRNATGSTTTRSGLLEGTAVFPPVPIGIQEVTMQVSNLTVEAPGGNGALILPGPWRIPVPLG